MSIQARIIAEKGSIVIGNDNLIEEAVLIKNTNEETLYIWNENIFEVQSEFIGEFPIFCSVDHKENHTKYSEKRHK